MKDLRFRITIKNRSAWPIDIVWENAQDLEHVAFLHRSTNYRFRVLDVEARPDGAFPYDRMAYQGLRRLFGFLPVSTFGFRRVLGPYEIRQIDISPLLGISTALRSTLERDPEDPGKTILVDEVEVSAPALLSPFRAWIEASLRRHARIQCAEDEAFRARRHALRERGIPLPFSVLNRSLWEERFSS